LRENKDVKLAEVLEELSSLTIGERQTVIRRALELDETPFSAAEETLIEERLEAHRKNPDTARSLEEMKRRLKTRVSK
jgi:hypothetical protein